MKARLFSHASSLRVDHEFADEVTVGRGANNSLSLPSRLLSAYHARIAWDEALGCYRLQDMGSTNGTRLDGRRVEDALLGHLHVVTLADQLDIVFQDLERCAARRQARQAESLSPPPPAGGESAAEGPPLSEKTQHTSIKSLALALPELLRAPGAQAAPATPTQDGPVKGGPEKDAPVTDGTLLERLPLPLPSFLQKSGAGAGDQASAPPRPATPVRLPKSSEGASRPTVDWSATTRDADEDATGEDATEKAPDAGSAPAEPPPASQRDVFFLAAHSSAGTVHYELREGINLIGRSMDAEVRIDSPEVSRRHAQLTLHEGRMMLRDLGSRNRTFVGGEPLAKEAVNVMPGERLRFGALEVVIGVTAGERPDQAP